MMPFGLHARDVAILVMLVSCVPLQNWLVQKHKVSIEQQSAYVFEAAVKFQNFLKWFSMSAWCRWIYLSLNKASLEDYSRWYPDDGGPEGVCPAVEVLNYNSPEGYFGLSPIPREERPVQVKYRIGQTVKHWLYGYRGVIIGWDLTCKAPEKWIEEMHGKNVHWRHQPSYALLVDIRNRPIPQLTYVVQENIVLDETDMVHHPEMERYFEYYDGAKYHPQHWIRMIYPLD